MMICTLILQVQSLLEYEKHLRQNGDLNLPGLALLPPAGLEKEVRISYGYVQFKDSYQCSHTHDS